LKRFENVVLRKKCICLFVSKKRYFVCLAKNKKKKRKFTGTWNGSVVLQLDIACREKLLIKSVSFFTLE
jgi:hypothetical protein